MTQPSHYGDFCVKTCANALSNIKSGVNPYGIYPTFRKWQATGVSKFLAMDLNSAPFAVYTSV